MSESMLQREFKGKDVQRMRNIITKDYGDKTPKPQNPKTPNF